MRWKTCAEKYLLVVQQQHNWIQLFAGPIVRTKGDDEVIQSVPSRLRRNDNQFVLKPVGFGVFKAVVLAALCGGRQRRDSARGSRPPTHHARSRPAPGGDASTRQPHRTLSSLRQQKGAFSGKRWHRVGELPM